MTESYYAELKDFLATTDCVKSSLNLKLAGPIQNVPKSCFAYEIGCRIILPLPFGQSNLAIQIMEETEKWTQVRGLERFGYIEPHDCPLLLIGLRDLPPALQEAVLFSISLNFYCQSSSTI